MNRRTTHWPCAAGPILLVAALLVAYWRLESGSAPSEPESPSVESGAPSAASPAPIAAAQLQRVERVVDGDTLLLADGRRVRLIGVDTPETVRPNYPVEPLGPEAAAFTRQFIGRQPVRLESDGPPLDEYGRTLAVVWVDERMLNEELLRAGLATAMLRFEYSEALKRRYRAAQQEAQRAGRGLWALEPAQR